MLWYDIQSHKWIDMISHDVIWYQKSLNWYVMIFSGGLGRESREWCDWRRVAFARWDHQVIVSCLSSVCLFGPSGDCLSSVCDQECLSGHDNEKDNLILLHNWTRKTIGRLLVCGSVCLSGPDMVQTGWDGCRQTKKQFDIWWTTFHDRQRAGLISIAPLIPGKGDSPPDLRVSCLLSLIVINCHHYHRPRRRHDHDNKE